MIERLTGRTVEAIWLDESDAGFTGLTLVFDDGSKLELEHGLRSIAVTVVPPVEEDGDNWEPKP